MEEVFFAMRLWSTWSSLRGIEVIVARFLEQMCSDGIAMLRTLYEKRARVETGIRVESFQEWLNCR